jgi:hypothetical protein
MLIIAGAADVNIEYFIQLIRESSCDFTVQPFYDWQKTNIIPQGFIYIKVLPEISFNRLNKTNTPLSLNDIQKTAHFLTSYFIDKTIMPQQWHTIPLLTLNGFIDFEIDLSQFYNHLFYIKKFFNEIKEKENKEKGIYVAPKKHSGCKC